jgi:hypothetical protein
MFEKFRKPAYEDVSPDQEKIAMQFSARSLAVAHARLQGKVFSELPTAEQNTLILQFLMLEKESIESRDNDNLKLSNIDSVIERYKNNIEDPEIDFGQPSI